MATNFGAIARVLAHHRFAYRYVAGCEGTIAETFISELWSGRRASEGTCPHTGVGVRVLGFVVVYVSGVVVLAYCCCV